MPKVDIEKELLEINQVLAREFVRDMAEAINRKEREEIEKEYLEIIERKRNAKIQKP